MQVPGGRITGAGIAAWPYSVGVLCKFTAFFFEPCIGRWVLRTWVILGFPIWNFLSYSSNGLVTGCPMKRLLGLTCVLIVLDFPSVPVSEGI